jgi:hypothetical protein
VTGGPIRGGRGVNGLPSPDSGYTREGKVHNAANLHHYDIDKNGKSDNELILIWLHEYFYRQ